jgi:hypothetical protein
MLTAMVMLTCKGYRIIKAAIAIEGSNGYYGDEHGNPLPENLRSWIGSGTLMAYPSTGGIVLGTFTPVEHEYLGLSRFNTSYISDDPATEDQFALRLLQLGAHWWPRRRVFDHYVDNAPNGFYQRFKRVWLAFSSRDTGWASLVGKRCLGYEVPL